MTGLREMFEDLAVSPPPPSQVTGEEMYAAGRRRRKRRTRIVRAVAALAVTAVAAATASVVTMVSPPPEPASSGDPLPAGNINWIGAADSRHLYAAVQACPDQSCVKTLVQLYASDNGGQGWTPRGDAMVLVDAVVAGPSTLVATVAGKSTPSVSTNGGHTWTSAQRRSQAAAVPPGGTLFCWASTDAELCSPYVVDPAAGWFAPLARPPALRPGAQWMRAGDRLWGAGADLNGISAVAVSTDAGHTWSTRTLQCPRAICYGATVATTADGNTAYAVVTSPNARFVYRGGVTGAWTLTGIEKITAHEAALGGDRSFVTADGTHVVYGTKPVGDLDGRTFSANSGTDTPYQPVVMDGLPALVRAIGRAPDGWFFTSTYGPERAVYGSTDGRHWSVIASTLTKE
ncbi:hypothetical protein [Phytohabitans aurantiacus]|uniref:Exo-alpha-sialidase n=1 Tax=Phytohabitans aurantiacus TaxID=3016789 RepID=A0ABQ5QMC4_9ACTN|nr:hypothetical protein [Phytohabitans aurantiacus]GLH95698.1 hypothetical protein Pa4123_09700 [Phytohabitans aurantiacus]